LRYPNRARGTTKRRPSRYEARVGGRPVRYEAAGEGEPVVLVHGLSGSSRWWSRNASSIAERYRVYFVDLPGFGKMRRLGRPFVLAEAASWLSGWMEAVGFERAHLVGHSMGDTFACASRRAGPRPCGALSSSPRRELPPDDPCSGTSRRCSGRPVTRRRAPARPRPGRREDGTRDPLAGG
jgi:pimeloyl-ACP methyl ester carboxylesterase